jgi:hypothetical protein
MKRENGGKGGTMKGGPNGVYLLRRLSLVPRSVHIRVQRHENGQAEFRMWDCSATNK